MSFVEVIHSSISLQRVRWVCSDFPIPPPRVKACSDHPLQPSSRSAVLTAPAIFPPRFCKKVMDPWDPPLKRCRSDFFFHRYVSHVPIMSPCVQPCFQKAFCAEPPGQWLPQGWEELTSIPHAFHSGTSTACQAHHWHNISISLFSLSVCSERLWHCN